MVPGGDHQLASFWRVKGKYSEERKFILNNYLVRKYSGEKHMNMNMNMNGLYYFEVYAELRYVNAKSLPYVKWLHSVAP